MFELASAVFSIADANEFRFARFYIVCEAASLGTPGSPLIVCDLSDTLRKCPNVEETRNPMQTSSRKKCSHFSPTNFHLHFQLKSAWCASYNIPYRLKAAARPMQQSLLLQDKSLDHLGDRIVIVVVLRHIIRCGFHLRRGIFYRYPDMRRIKHCNIILLISHRYRTV